MQNIPIRSTRENGEENRGEREAREEVESYQVLCRAVGGDEEENLRDERDPGGSDERIEGDKSDISDEICEGDDEIDLQEFLLFVVSDKKVGEERREEIEEEYKNDDLHGIE